MGGEPGCRRRRREAGDGAGRGGSADGAVRVRVHDAVEELALDVRVIVVLDLVVRPARQLARNQRPPAHRRPLHA